MARVHVAGPRLKRLAATSTSKNIALLDGESGFTFVNKPPHTRRKTDRECLAACLTAAARATGCDKRRPFGLSISGAIPSTHQPVQPPPYHHHHHHHRRRRRRLRCRRECIEYGVVVRVVMVVMVVVVATLFCPPLTLVEKVFRIMCDTLARWFKMLCRRR